MPPTSVLIVDDHPIFRGGLKQILKKDKTIKLAAEASNGKDALLILQEHTITIAICDMDMPQMNGLELLKRAQELQIATHFIFLTMYQDETLFSHIMTMGARGFILKENAAEELLQNIHEVIQGNYGICTRLLPAFQNWKAKKKTTDISLFIDALSPMERKILHSLSMMKTNREIAAIYFISEKTVENHRVNIAHKLGLQGAHAVMKFAVEYKAFI